MSNPLNKDDVRAIIDVLRQQQSTLWPAGWKFKHIEGLIIKLQLAHHLWSRHATQNTASEQQLQEPAV